MFRARDSCGADVRRGRSPKCLFIKATATGNTINGLNDEINKLPAAGHGGARRGLRWPGRHRRAQPQACLPARRLPCPAALPAPQGPAWLPRHPCPTPALALSPRGDTRPTRSPSGAQRSLRCPGEGCSLADHGGRFRAPTLPEPPKWATSVPN